jgi:hypothetical protein
MDTQSPCQLVSDFGKTEHGGTSDAQVSRDTGL